MRKGHLDGCPKAAVVLGVLLLMGATHQVYRVHVPRATLFLSTAANQVERERGLMLVSALPVHSGMLFKFADGDRLRVFWMKNTLIPLDMIFVKADGMVNNVAAHVPVAAHGAPNEKIPRRYGFGEYVIELNAGEAKRDGITVGQRLVLPEVVAQ